VGVVVVVAAHPTRVAVCCHHTTPLR